MNWATLIAAVLAIGLLVADRLMPEPASEAIPANTEAPGGESAADGPLDRDPDPASIAVLPFDDLSPDGDRSYFSDGIAEEILNVLVGIDGLAVASRTSSFQFKGNRSIGIPEIADHLGVRNVLEGSVRAAGNPIRVTAQLIDGVSDQHLWSQTFDRELSTENLFAIQDEISGAIVRAIREKLGIELEAPEAVAASTGSVGAYSLFLRARTLFRARSFFEESDALLIRALRLDPAFADAMALRAALLIVAPEYGVHLLESESASRQRAQALAREALAINPRQALAHAVLGLVRDFELLEGNHPVRYREILDNYDAALAISPDDLATRNWRGFAYLRAGYLDQAQADFAHCVEVEPGYAPCSSNLAAALALAGRSGEARDVVESAIRLGVFTGDIASLITLHQLGDERGFYFHAIRMPTLRGWLGMEEIYTALRRPGEDHEPRSSGCARTDSSSAPAIASAN